MEPRLSARLEAILGLLSPCECLVDVGTDHALVPLAAVARGIAGRAIAIDRKAAPLAGAEANRAAAGLGARVDLRLGDGLTPLAAGEADALAMAGIGGRLAVRILEAHPDRVTGFKQLVLQPNQEAEALRVWARRHGWHLVAETLVEERGLFFPVLKWVPGTGPDPAYVDTEWSERSLEVVGPWLVRERSAVTRKYWEAQRDRLRRLDSKTDTRNLELLAFLERLTAQHSAAPSVSPKDFPHRSTKRPS